MNNRITVLTNILWRFGERLGAQVVSFVVTIVIARLLEPEAFGVIALVNVFIEFADVLVASGFGSAVIQKKDADDLDYSSAFYFQMVLSGILYITIFVAAPFIQAFYGKQYSQMTVLVRVLGLRLFFVALNSMQNAYTSRHMQYKKFFFATIIGTVISAVVGIVAAWKGFGVWALVMQYMTNSIVDTLILWITVEWHPVLKFSFARLKLLYSFGWKMLASSLVDIAYQKMRDLLIGKMYSSADLAFYNRGSSYPGLVVSNINTSIDNVLFPVMSKEQNDRTALKKIVQRSIKSSSYLIYPMMMGLALCGRPLILLMLTEKWLPAVPYLQIFCFIFALQPINTANINAIKSMGRSDLYLKLGLLKDIIGIALLIIFARFGVIWIAISSAITSVFGMFLNVYPNMRLLDYSLSEQIADVSSSIFLTLAMGLCVYCVGLLSIPPFIMLCIQVLIGVIVYLTLSIMFKVDTFTYIWSIICNMRNKSDHKLQ